MIEKIPEGITPILLEGILMPNGEVITSGKTVGRFNELHQYLYDRNEMVAQSREWECTQCGHTTMWGYDELVSSGTPQCPTCDDDMSLVAE